MKKKKDESLGLPMLGTCLNILEHWNSKKIIQHRDDTKTMSKTFDKLASLLRGRNRYAIADIKKAIDVYAEILSIQDITFDNKRLGYRVGLDEFILGFNPYTRLSMEKCDSPLLRIESWFKECLDREAAMLRWGQNLRRLPTEIDVLAELIMDTYLSIMRLPREELSTKDLLKIKVAAEKLHKLSREWEPRLNRIMSATDWVNFMFHVVESKMEGRAYTPGFLCNRYLFSFDLPRELRENMPTVTDDERQLAEFEQRRLME